jgi:hypothetical protein
VICAFSGCGVWRSELSFPSAVLKVPQRHCSTSLVFLTRQTRHLHSPGLVDLFFDSPAAAITPSIASKRVNSVSRWCGQRFRYPIWSLYSPTNTSSSESLVSEFICATLRFPWLVSMVVDMLLALGCVGRIA